MRVPAVCDRTSTQFHDHPRTFALSGAELDRTRLGTATWRAATDPAPALPPRAQCAVDKQRRRQRDDAEGGDLLPVHARYRACRTRMVYFLAKVLSDVKLTCSVAFSVRMTGWNGVSSPVLKPLPSLKTQLA